MDFNTMADLSVEVKAEFIVNTSELIADFIEKGNYKAAVQLGFIYGHNSRDAEVSSLQGEIKELVDAVQVAIRHIDWLSEKHENVKKGNTFISRELTQLISKYTKS